MKVWIVFGLMAFLVIVPSVYGWWDDGDDWARRKSVTINGSNQTTNFVVYMNIDYDTDMLANFFDIRFLSNCSDDAEELNYYLNATASTSAHAWVRTDVDDIICMYYGNPGATNTSNGTNTFVVFDDFENVNDTGWDQTYGAGVTFHTVLQRTGGNYVYNLSAPQGTDDIRMEKNDSVGDTVAIEMDIYIDQDNDDDKYYPLRFGIGNVSGVWMASYNTSSDGIYVYDGQNWITVTTTANPPTLEDAWFHVKIIRYSNTTTSFYHAETMMNRSMIYQGDATSENMIRNGSAVLDCTRGQCFYDNIMYYNYQPDFTTI
jgi:hypothetical protein